MRKFRFSLDKSPRKFLCPQCGRRTFVRYVDTWANSYVENPSVGRCDRSSKCAYHLPPHKAGIRYSDGGLTPCKQPEPLPESPPGPYTLPIDTAPFFAHRRESAFYRFLSTIAPSGERLEEVAAAYRLGANRTGGVIFWQTDLSGAVRTGKIMHYDPQSGKRLHSVPPQWVHTKVSKPQNWQLRQCPFGLHLLNGAKEKPIGLVESEKTAVVMSLFVPERVWIAVGGKHNLSERLISQIPRSQIDLYPDKDAFELWQTLAQSLQSPTHKTLRLIPWHLPHPDLPPSADPADLIANGFFNAPGCGLFQSVSRLWNEG